MNIFKWLKDVITSKDHYHTSEDYEPADGERSLVITVYEHQCVQCNVLKIRKEFKRLEEESKNDAVARTKNGHR